MSLRAMLWAWERPVETASERLVLLAIADHADNDGMCWPGLKGVAEKCLLSTRQLLRVVAALEARGLVAVERRKLANGRQTSSRYLLDLPPSRVTPCHPADRSPGDTMSPGPGDTMSPGSVANVTRPLDARASSNLNLFLEPVKDPDPKSRPVDNSTGQEAEKIKSRKERKAEFRRMMGLVDDSAGVGVTGDLDLGRAAAAFDTNREKAETAGSWGGQGMAGGWAELAGIKRVDGSQARPGESRIEWELRRRQGENVEKGESKPVEVEDNVRKR